MWLYNLNIIFIYKNEVKLRSAIAKRNKRFGESNIWFRNLLFGEYSRFCTYYVRQGNLIKGFDNYLNARAPRNQINKKPKIENIERLFSLTSIRSKTSEAFDETFIS